MDVLEELLSGSKFYSRAMGVDKIGLEMLAQFPVQTNLILFWAGPAFPLSLLVLWFMMIVRRVQPAWIGALIVLGAIAFPASRISRIEWVAHIADSILLIPLVGVYINSSRE